MAEREFTYLIARRGRSALILVHRQPLLEQWVAQLFDYVDRHVPMLARMFEKRLRAYRAIGYERAEVPLDDDWSHGEPLAQWENDDVGDEPRV